MEMDKSEPFEVLIATRVKLSVTRVRIDNSSYFEITTQGKYHGRVYPALCSTFGIYWKSTDDIHPWFVKLLGDAIESYDA